MNKRGFTLIELLAVIAIIALISLIAIPNIVGLSDGIRQDEVLDDAKKLISMAKYKVNTDYDIRNFLNEDICDKVNKRCTMSFTSLNKNNDIDHDPDSTEGENYIDGYVRYEKSGDNIKYCAYLEGHKRILGRKKTDNTYECIEEEGLYSRHNVVDKSVN